MKLLKKLYTGYFGKEKSGQSEPETFESGSWKQSEQMILVGNDLSVIKQVAVERANTTLYVLGAVPFELADSFALKLHNVQIKSLKNLSEFFEVMIQSKEPIALWMRVEDIFNNEFALRRLSKARNELQIVWAYTELASIEHINLLRELCNIVVLGNSLQNDGLSFSNGIDIYQATSSQIPSYLSLV